MDTLEQMETDVLRRLMMLSEGGTLDLDRPSLHRVHPGSSVPPGVSENGVESHLRPEVSLWAYHEYRLRKARERGFVAHLMALAEAERDYEISQHRPPSYTSPDSEQNAKDRDEAILRWEGRRPEQVAVFENCSASYVRKIRKKANRDQTWGGVLDAAEA